MDQESLAKIQQIVGAATEALRTDIAEIKRHTDDATEALRADIADAKRYTSFIFTQPLTSANTTDSLFVP